MNCQTRAHPVVGSGVAAWRLLLQSDGFLKCRPKQTHILGLADDLDGRPNHHWKPRIVVTPTLSSLLVSAVVAMRTSSSASEDKGWHHNDSCFSVTYTVISPYRKTVLWDSPCPDVFLSCILLFCVADCPHGIRRCDPPADDKVAETHPESGHHCCHVCCLLLALLLGLVLGIWRPSKLHE